MLSLVTQSIQDQINPKRTDPATSRKKATTSTSIPHSTARLRPLDRRFVTSCPANSRRRPKAFPSGPKTRSENPAASRWRSKINYSVSTACIPFGPCCAVSDPRPVPVKVHKQVHPSDPLNSPGLLEDSFARGAIVQATTCFHEQIINEVRSKHHLTVNSSSGCYAIAADFQGLTAEMNGLTSSLKSQPNIKDILSCKKGWDRSLGTQGKDQGPLRQSAQQLCAARAALESMFGHLVACEVLARAQKSYVNVIGSAQGQKSILDMIQSGVAEPCGDTCTKSMSWCNIIPAHKVEKCVNECYRNRMPAAFRDFIKQRWKSDGSQCDLSMNESGLLMIGMLQLLGSRRRKKERARPRVSGGPFTS